MKKAFSILMTLAMAVVLSFSLTGCDEDSDVAYTLAGTWRGYMQVSTEYNDVRYQSIYSEICFNQDPYSFRSGDGYWIDFYQNGGWGSDYLANHIQWTVRDRAIYIHFDEEGTDLVIENYGLNDNQFYGQIYYGNTVVNFSLTHISSPNWNDYNFGYGYDEYFGYAKPNGKVAPLEKPKRYFGTPKD